MSPLSFGPLETVVIEPEGGAPVEGVVLLCHGFGAPGTDLVGLADMFRYAEPEWAQKTAFVFPAAPLDLGDIGMYGGRAWWPINMAKLQEQIASRDIRRLVEETPPGLHEARQQLTECVTACLTHYGLTADRLVLGGFSQGAMVTTDLALSLSPPPAGLIVFSGMLINAGQWRTATTEQPARFPVWQSHGRYDVVLPFEGAVALQNQLTSQKWSVTFEPFAGGHEIPRQALGSAIRFAKNSLSQAKPS